MLAVWVAGLKRGEVNGVVIAVINKHLQMLCVDGSFSVIKCERISAVIGRFDILKCH